MPTNYPKSEERRSEWLTRVFGGPVARRIKIVLVLASIADVATTARALSLGAPERSPGGAAVLAAAGIAGLIGLKVGAIALVWILDKAWPAVGRGVGGGLTCMTAAAVTWNFYVLGSAGARLAG